MGITKMKLFKFLAQIFIFGKVSGRRRRKGGGGGGSGFELSTAFEGINAMSNIGSLGIGVAQIIEANNQMQKQMDHELNMAEKQKQDQKEIIKYGSDKEKEAKEEDRINYIKQMIINNENEKALIKSRYEFEAEMDRKNGIEDVCIQCNEKLFDMENKIDKAVENSCEAMIFHAEHYETCKQLKYNDPEFSKDIFEEMNGQQNECLKDGSEFFKTAHRFTEKCFRDQNQLNKVLNMACHFEKAYNIDQWCWLQSNVETRRHDVERINMGLDRLDHLDDILQDDQIEGISAVNAAVNIGSLGTGALPMYYDNGAATLIESNYQNQVPQDYRLEMIEKQKQNQVEQIDVQDDQNEGLEATCTACYKQLDWMASSMNEIDADCQDSANEDDYNLCKEHYNQMIFAEMGGQENDCLKTGSDFFKMAQMNECFESEEHLIWTLDLACHYGNANNIDQWCSLQSEI